MPCARRASCTTALDEGETTPAAILETFAPDDRVRFLDNQDLWVFEVAPRWWNDASPILIDRVRQHTAFVLERAVEEALVSHRDIVAAKVVRGRVAHDELAGRAAP